ncbi:MAG: hypothetical protein C4541_00465 [Candidatus Auribacter fodinae]|uniref:Uncharacterized protein n=1 Tax=Candidatus Auribacter fodinae TaxID=2093366 RepID=A0A3A4RBB1_9BACT|nr:MAG: hypothetical protein C4541_00465 [Candidatus Auribacter fodinae]
MIKPLKLERDLIIVIRTADERTAGLCKEILKKQVDAGRIHVIEEKPFFRAVQKTIEIGSQSTAPYLLALDADMLLYPDAMEYIFHALTLHDFNLSLKWSFWVHDKFRGEVKAGIHLYNNRYSKEFYAFLKKIDPAGEWLRPESDNMKIFAKQHNLEYSYAPEHIVAQHDFHQYYRDLFPKYRLRYLRCKNDGKVDNVQTYIAEQLAENPNDMDFAFVQAIFDTAEENVTLNDILNRCGIDEKQPLKPDEHKAIINELSSKSVIADYTNTITGKMKQWTDSYELFKSYVKEKFICENLTGNTAVYGTGALSEIVLMAKNDLNITAIIDRDPANAGSYLCGIPIIPIEQISEHGIQNIVIGSLAHKDQIRERINSAFANNDLNIISMNV